MKISSQIRKYIYLTTFLIYSHFSSCLLLMVLRLLAHRAMLPSLSCVSIYFCCSNKPFERSIKSILVNSLQFHCILSPSINSIVFKEFAADRPSVWEILQPTSVATVNRTLIAPLQRNWQLESPVSVESLYRSTRDQARGFGAAVLTTKPRSGVLFGGLISFEITGEREIFLCRLCASDQFRSISSFCLST